MTLVNDAGLDPTNVTYDMAFDGRSTHAAATIAIGKKYITTDALFPDGSGGFLAVGALALCTSATTPETWVALKTPNGMRIADSSTGIIWLRTPNTNTTYNGWNAIEAWLDIVADYMAADVSAKLNTLFTTVSAISNSIAVHLGATPQTGPFTFQGWKITSPVTNTGANPVFCHGPIYWTGTASNVVALTIGNSAGTEPSTIDRSEYWIEYSNNLTPNYPTKVTGIQLLNMSEGRFRVRSRFFWLGVDLAASAGGHGCASNDIDIASTYGSLKSVSWTAGSSSFVNENTLHLSDTTHAIPPTGDSACALRISLDTGAEANGNKWYGGPSFEDGPTPPGTYNVIELTGARTGFAVLANEFHGMRLDAGTPSAFIACNGSFAMAGNLFNIAYTSVFPTFSGSNAAAVTACQLNTFEIPAFDPGTGAYEAHPAITFGRSNVTQRLSGGSLLLQAPARGKIYMRTTAAFANETLANYGQLTAQSIQLAATSLSMMGVFLDVRSTPHSFLNRAHFRMTLRPGLATATAGRLGLIAYAPDGQTIVNSANDIQTYSQGTLNPLLASATSFESPGDLSPSNSGVDVAWSSNVGFLFLFATGGSVQADFLEAEVFTVADSGAVPLYDSLAMPVLGPNLPLIDDDLPYSNGVPANPVIQFVAGVIPGATTEITTTASNTYAVGDPIYFTGLGGITGLNGVTANVTSVASATTFFVGVATSGSYTSGGTTQTDFVPRGQTVRAMLPAGTSGTAAEWVRTASDTWVARNF